MNEIVFQARRRFQLWSYTVSHGQMLLRSPKSMEYDTRVDIGFKDVLSINIPVVMEGITITRVSDPISLAQYNRGGMQVTGREYFAVTGPNCDGYVVAGLFTVASDHGEHSDDSMLIGY